MEMGEGSLETLVQQGYKWSDKDICAIILAGIPRRRAESLIPTGGGIARILARMLPRHRIYRYGTAAAAIVDLQAEYWGLQSVEEP
jgi:hypothetical protein